MAIIAWLESARIGSLISMGADATVVANLGSAIRAGRNMSIDIPISDDYRIQSRAVAYNVTVVSDVIGIVSSIDAQKRI